MPILAAGVFSEDTLVPVGLVLLIVSGLWNHFRAVSKLSVSIASTDATASKAIEAVREMKDVAKDQGVKLDKLVENTAAMASDIRHLAERQNGTVHRDEFRVLSEQVGAVDRRVTALEAKGGG